MSIEIYYFSGTGNSLVVASDISKKLEGKLIPIASVMDTKTISPKAGVIGIVFPVYYVTHDCIPLIVGRFVNKLENIKSKYIFAVCTFGGGSFKTLDNINKLLISRNSKLSAGFGVQMPQNAFYKSFENHNKMFKKWKKKLMVICKTVTARKTNNFDDIRNLLIKLILTPFIPKLQAEGESAMQKFANSPGQNLTFNELILLSDNSYQSDENCNGCGICSKVCPVNNIKIVNKKPVWQNHCENCLACFNWCPQKAIQGGISNENYHYHHPDVKVKNMLREK